MYRQLAVAAIGADPEGTAQATHRARRAPHDPAPVDVHPPHVDRAPTHEPDHPLGAPR